MKANDKYWGDLPKASTNSYGGRSLAISPGPLGDDRKYDVATSLSVTSAMEMESIRTSH